MTQKETFEYYLQEQLKVHPSIQPRDVAKLCFQAARGAEHILTDIEKAREYFFSEFNETEETDEPLYEYICPELVRMNMGAFKKQGLDPVRLFNMFLYKNKMEHSLEELLDRADGKVKECAGFSYSEWREFLDWYKEQNMPSLHHSEIYREREKPHYRVVSSDFVRILPVLLKARDVAGSENAGVIAIDGRAGSGKSTCASLLSIALNCSVICLDDFFLPPELRNEERFSVPGNNIHKERFIAEVIPFIKSKYAFSYNRFDCSKMAMGEGVTVNEGEWRIAEGSYSLHPEFGKYYDIGVFSYVDSETQKNRIICRNGIDMAENFFSRWIPLEEAYFSHFNIKEKADIVI